MDRRHAGKRGVSSCHLLITLAFLELSSYEKRTTNRHTTSRRLLHSQVGRSIGKSLYKMYYRFIGIRTFLYCLAPNEFVSVIGYSEYPGQSWVSVILAGSTFGPSRLPF